MMECELNSNFIRYALNFSNSNERRRKKNNAEMEMQNVWLWAGVCVSVLAQPHMHLDFIVLLVFCKTGKQYNLKVISRCIICMG